MSRTFKRITGSGAGGYFAAGDRFYLTAQAIPLQYDLEMAALGQFCRNRPIGGSTSKGLLPFSAVTNDILDPIYFTIDNSNSQLTNSTNVVAQVTAWVRVEDPSITITPVVWNASDVVASVTGAACSATANGFTGTNSKQTLTMVLAAGVKTYKLMATPSATTFQYWVIGWLDLYINL